MCQPNRWKIWSLKVQHVDHFNQMRKSSIKNKQTSRYHSSHGGPCHLSGLKQCSCFLLRTVCLSVIAKKIRYLCLSYRLINAANVQILTLLLQRAPLKVVWLQVCQPNYVKCEFWERENKKKTKLISARTSNVKRLLGVISPLSGISASEPRCGPEVDSLWGPWSRLMPPRWLTRN